MKKLSTLKIIVFLIHLQCVMAQNPANVSGCSIWKKQTTSKIVTDKKETNLVDFLNFNEGVSFSKDEQLIVSKSKLKSSFTLFVVFKSIEDKEKDIVKYKVGREELKITNKQTQSTNGLEYSKYDAKSGVILEYSANLNGVKNANICSLFFGDKSNNDKDSSQNQEWCSCQNSSPKIGRCEGFGKSFYNKEISYSSKNNADMQD